MRSAAPDDEEELDDGDAPDDLGAEPEVEFVDPEPSGVMLTVEMFAHWSGGSRVTLMLKMMSAHYFISAVSGSASQSG